MKGILTLLMVLSITAHSQEGDVPVWGSEAETQQTETAAQNLPIMQDPEKLAELAKQLEALQGDGGMTKETQEKYIDMIIENNPFAQFPPEQMEQLISNSTQGTKLEGYLNRFPKLKTFLSHWIVDKEAFPKFLSLTKKKRRLRNLGVFSFIFVLFGFFIASKLTQHDTFMITKFIKKTGIRLCASLAGLMLFYFAFYRELSPTWKLVKLHLF